MRKHLVFWIVMAFALEALPLMALPTAPQQTKAANAAPPSPPEPPYNQTKNQSKSKGKDYSMTCSDGHCTSNDPSLGPRAPYPSFPASALAPQTPQATQSVQQKSSKPSESNAFPEAKSLAAQKKAEERAPEPPPCTGPCSSSNQRMAGMDVLGNGRSQYDDGTGKPVHNPELAKQDDQVGRFYLGSGDYVGAYSRFLEATQVNPGDAYAVFGLAEAEYHMGRNQQAIQNFQIYLSAVPRGHDAHEARKILSKLGAKF